MKNEQGKEKIKRCQERLRQLLTEEDCHLEPIMHVTTKGIVSQIAIVPNQPKNETKGEGL